ncbi:hypothetical protein H9I30_17680 [Morganella morganii]|uniref:hypothetical protein n=1 Tax=Morganella morganii TaxID=582 RepID=UPI0016515F33|nr:hypothetical protein [Morganella morganii]MBC6659819.1 hypothetical protein [Morganella morganii]
MDISRQQFEEFIKFHAAPAELERELKKANNGINYLDPVIDLMWIGWKESRESLEIQLPEADADDGCPNYHSGYNAAMSDAYDAITMAGVRVDG